MPCRWSEFPHLYRCGHIEAARTVRSYPGRLSRFPHLYRCGHIEASPNEKGKYLCGVLDFRIFIDAATLKPEIHASLIARMSSDFRIFIDAATLKPGSGAGSGARVSSEFPHLYRCGHIEAYFSRALPRGPARFPHLYRCGHIEATRIDTGIRAAASISASL